MYPQWFAATWGILWNSAQVCMLSRGLQCSSPRREPRTSQILPRITPSSLLSSPLFTHFISGYVFLSESLVLVTNYFSLSVHLFLFSLPYFIDTTPLSSLCLCECSASSPAASREKQESKEEEKIQEKLWENGRTVKGRKTTQAYEGLIRNRRWQRSVGG